MHFRSIAVAALLASALAGPAAAATLASYTAGTETASFAPGQSFTVAGTGQFNSLSFSFYNAALTPTAVGSLYLFTTAYTGTPAALAATTANRIGVAAASSTAYVFQPALQLTGGVQYFAYADTVFTLSGSGSGAYAGGNLFVAGATTSAFISVAAQDANFLVTGNAVGVPEPASWALMIGGVGLIGGAMRRRKVATRVAFA